MRKTAKQSEFNFVRTPQFIIDRLNSLLTGNEIKCLLFVIRKTIGWDKTTDRISKSQIQKNTGLSELTVSRCMAELVRYRVVCRRAENDHNLGVQWEVNLDLSSIAITGLEKRQQQLSEINHKRTKQALNKRLSKKGKK